MRSRPLGMLLVMLALLGGTAVLPASAEITNPSAEQLAEALASGSNVITGAQYFEGPPSGAAVLVATDPLAGFPREGGSFGLLSTGAAAHAYLPNNEGDRSTDYGTTSTRSISVHDVTVLKIDLTVPAPANCLLGVDFRFLSDEHPEYVGSSYNDAFIAEVDQSTWTVTGNQINSPGNFAFDQQGNPITVNAAGAATMTAEFAAGTTYDGATDLLSAATPLTPGPHSLYFSLFDTGDGGYDSAVLIDNLRVGRVADVQSDCRPGAEAVTADTYLALGDSYSAGFGVSPYEPGTHQPNGNDCRRSTRAYSVAVAAATPDFGRQFFACRGAETRDFFEVRSERSSWNEEPQLDRLNASTGLVTYTIGGEDAGYAEILRDCIDDEDLLPFLTCYDDNNAHRRVDDALVALDGTGSDDGIHSYAKILDHIRTNAENAQVVQVGYPRLYPATGERCQGVKKADQRWAVEKIDELNAIIAKQAGRAGYLYAQPSFDDHELCSGGSQWIFGIRSEAGLLPNAAGQNAIGAAVTDALQEVDTDSFEIDDGERVTKTYRVRAGAELTTVAVRWPGSDVRTTLTSPSGEVYDRDDPPAGHTVGPSSEVFTVTDPEAGTWTIEMFGADIDPGGERVTYSTYQEEAPNTRPEARFSLVRAGTSLSLNASSSDDSDGSLASYEWYVETADDDQVLTGRRTTVRLPENEPASVTLVVTDDRGLTDFHTVNVPGIKWTSAPGAAPSDRVTIALLSSPDLDARTLSELRWGVQRQRVDAGDLRVRDANGDGRPDLVLRGTVEELGLMIDRQIVCVAGVLPDENPVLSCTPVTLAAAPEPTDPEPADPDPPDEPSDSADPPTDAPSTRAETSISHGSLTDSGGTSTLLLMVGVLSTAVAVGVLAAARRSRARS